MVECFKVDHHLKTKTTFTGQRKLYRCCLAEAKALGLDDGHMYDTYLRFLDLKKEWNPDFETLPEVPEHHGCKAKMCDTRRLRYNLATPCFPGMPSQDRLRASCYQYYPRKPTKYVPESFMNKLWTGFCLNQQSQLPLTTVLVRWQLNHTVQNYTTKEIYNIMSGFGPVSAIYQTSPNSALVVFEEVTTACRVVYNPQLRMLRNRMHCHWFHRYMANKSFYTTRQGLSVKTSPVN